MNRVKILRNVYRCDNVKLLREKYQHLALSLERSSKCSQIRLMLKYDAINCMKMMTAEYPDYIFVEPSMLTLVKNSEYIFGWLFKYLLSCYNSEDHPKLVFCILSFAIDEKFWRLSVDLSLTYDPYCLSRKGLIDSVIDNACDPEYVNYLQLRRR